MKLKLSVDKEFDSICWPLSAEEIVNLRSSLIDEGCREPVIYWRNSSDGLNPIIDGHHRHKLCGELKLELSSIGMDFDSREQAKNWIIRNQLGRRNASAAQYSYLRGQRVLTEKKSVGRPKASGGNSSKVELLTGDTAGRIAKEEGVGRSTIIRDAQFAEDVDKIGEVAPKVKQAIITEKVTRTVAHDLAELPVEQLAALEQVPESEVAKAVVDATAKSTGHPEFKSLEFALKQAEKAIGTAYRKSCELMDARGGREFHDRLRVEFNPIFIATRETMQNIVAEWKASLNETEAA